MKYILTLLTLFTFISCNDYQAKETEDKKLVKRKIDPILKDILKQYPNYKDNQIVRDNAAKALDKKIDSALSLGTLNDIPLKVFRIGKNPHGKGALIQFYTDNYDDNKSDVLSDRLNFDIIGFMDENLASTLKDKGTYYVYGKKFKRLNKTETFLIVNQVYYSPQTEISKDAIWDIYDFKIGDILCEIDSVKMTNKY
jgi:hypothetical protein